MFDWIGSLRVRETSDMRVVLSLSRSTRVVGGLLFVAAAAATWWVWAISHWLAITPAALAALGALLMTMKRELVFDRDAGVLRVDQSALGLTSRSVVPLFHLRAVVIVARDQGPRDKLRELVGPRKFVAYVERRVGDAIYLDESKRCASLLAMAEKIADVAELRLEYDATWRAKN
jgi:hypothetical protein